jgi:hypothetical protein
MAEAMYYGVRWSVIHSGFTDTPMVRPTLTLTHEVILLCAHNQDRTGGLMHNLLGVTAFDDVAQPSAIVRRDDDQIDS